jgi:4-alpha-glucanotransferase
VTSPPTPTLLERLARRMGIEQEFDNAHGEPVRTSEATNRRLLEAMGIALGDATDTGETLDRLEDADWLRSLPPVRVSRSPGHPVPIELSLPAGAGTVRWRLKLEEGSKRSGEVQFEQLALLARRVVKGRVMQRRVLLLPSDLPHGYHELELLPGVVAMSLIVAPQRCWLPAELENGERVWGIAVQLYLMRSRGNWGSGDYGDLRRLVELGAARGADVVGLNPLHAQFPDDPEHASPYSPASRLLLNVLYIDVSAVPELLDCAAARAEIVSPDFQRELTRCRAQQQLDYSGVWGLKLKVLTILFDSCRLAPDRNRWQAFEQYQRERGGVLEQTCVFFALRERFARASPAAPDWRLWPPEFRDCHSPAVRRFARDERGRVDFFAWLQWIAETQLAVAAEAASNHGMCIGLYRDLAVGSDAAGAETWVHPGAFIAEAHAGAPPDIHNPAGQDWGLPPYNPSALRDERYQSFVSLIRANMRCAGGLRIDHVMGLQHLYCIPAGSQAHEGAYVSYPLEDLLGILALESHRHQCIVVGEDLGTVTETFREAMAQANVLSYRVLFFEQDSESGAFRPPAAYPRLSLAVSGNHDLPTFSGWWAMTDIELKQRLGLYPAPDEAAHQRSRRGRDKERLVEALRREGLIKDEQEPQLDDLVRAAHRFLGRCRSLLAMVQLDDLTGELDQVNVPATSYQHPNWRRRLSLCLEDLPTHSGLVELISAFAAERGS